MIAIEIDEREVDRLIREEVERKLRDLTHRHTFWDMAELSEQTCMSITFIKENFFYDPRFPKYRVGRKWLMPARETEEFLLMWLKEKGS